MDRKDKSWTDEDMLKFARVASGGSYGDYKGCKSLQSKLEKYKLMKDLNKHRQVKSVDSNSMIRKNPPTREGEGFFKMSDMILVVKRYPNDADLGKFIRGAITSWKEK
tara:strand:- start:251 stop:574 length:324 start_codon:yes stop_codon:yes gene_type:complete